MHIYLIACDYEVQNFFVCDIVCQDLYDSTFSCRIIQMYSTVYFHSSATLQTTLKYPLISRTLFLCIGPNVFSVKLNNII